MSDAGLAVAAAATFVWLGMVLAISFLEAPLKFRAPGVDLRTGLSIGRLVFRALNVAELLLLTTLMLGVILGDPSTGVAVCSVLLTAVLAGQLLGVRPRLTRRSDRVLAGEDVPRGTEHHAYIVLEMIKVIVLIILGVLLLAS